MHAYPCEHCHGYGHFRFTARSFHDDGPCEFHTELATCPECDGNGLYPVTGAWCHICNEDIGPEDFTRIDRHGYEVHADCTDRSEDDAPDFPEPNPEDQP